MFVINATRIENGTSLTVVPHVCGLCKKAFLHEEALLNHIKTHENEPKTCFEIKAVKTEQLKINKPIENVQSNEKEVLSNEDVSVKKKHICDLCGRNFSSKTYLMKHIKLHKGERSYSCEICNKTFVLKDNLMKHFATHDPDKKRFFCLECGKGFTSRQYKEKHELIHLGEKPHICGICNKAFTLKTNLNKHILIHSEDRYRYVCGTCNKGFSSKAYLEKHHLLHAGEKPHVCGACHKAFTLKTNLHKHYLTHTGYRRFGCEVCSKRFKTKGSLEQHYVVHSGERPFTCSKCNQGFKQKAHLDKHFQVHLYAEKPPELISMNEDCIEVVIGGDKEIDEHFDDNVHFYGVSSDDGNSRAFNVNTESSVRNNTLHEVVLVQQSSYGTGNLISSRGDKEKALESIKVEK